MGNFRGAYIYKYTVCLGSTKYFFILFFCVRKGIFLKGMSEKLSLCEDEPLTPATAKVMAINVIHQYPHFWLFISINWKSCNQLCTSLEVIWPPN